MIDTEVKQTDKDKVILVLNESIRLAKESQFSYDKMYEKHKEITWIRKFDTTMKEKTELFKSLDENSYTFSRLKETAKMALVELQRGNGYNYYSAELILKFNLLEEFFRNRRLKSQGVRDAGEKVIIAQSEKKTDFILLSPEDGRLINGEMNGKKFVREEKKIKQLKETNFHE